MGCFKRGHTDTSCPSSLKTGKRIEAEKIGQSRLVVSRRTGRAREGCIYCTLGYVPTCVRRGNTCTMSHMDMVMLQPCMIRRGNWDNGVFRAAVIGLRRCGWQGEDWAGKYLIIYSVLDAVYSLTTLLTLAWRS